MTDDTKYITFIKNDIEGGIIFDNILKHSDMLILYNKAFILGAGFLYFNKKGKVECYGESISLRIKSRKNLDSKTINKSLNLDGENID